MAKTHDLLQNFCFQCGQLRKIDEEPVEHELEMHALLYEIKPTDGKNLALKSVDTVLTPKMTALLESTPQGVMRSAIEKMDKDDKFLTPQSRSKLLTHCKGKPSEGVYGQCICSVTRIEPDTELIASASMAQADETNANVIYNKTLPRVIRMCNLCGKKTSHCRSLVISGKDGILEKYTCLSSHAKKMIPERE